MPKSLLASVGVWLVGSVIGRLLFPRQSEAAPADLASMKLDGPTPGSPVPVVWGTRRIRGNVIWAAAPISRTGGGKKSSGGKKGGGGGGKKGGGSGATTYVRSWAHALGIGEMFLQQILINDEVVWDVTDPAIAAAAGVDITFHSGTQDQAVDARMAAQQAAGGGNVNPTITESFTLSGAGPTHTLGTLPIVAGSEVVFGTVDGEITSTVFYFTRVASSPGQNQYTIDNDTGLLTFGGAYSAQPVTARYQQSSATGAQEALAYPNVAYVYWHEFETGATPSIAQTTYIASRLTAGGTASFTDDFNRANGDVGGIWTDDGPDPPIIHGDFPNRMTMANFPGGGGGYIRIGETDTAPADASQYSSAILVQEGDDGIGGVSVMGAGAMAAQASGTFDHFTGYGFYYVRFGAGNHLRILYKWDDGDLSIIDSGSDPGRTVLASDSGAIADGSRVAVRLSGPPTARLVEGLVNGSVVLTHTDTSGLPIGGALACVNLRAFTSGPGQRRSVWDDYEGNSGRADFLLDWPPPQVVADVMQNALYGCGIDVGLIHAASLTEETEATIASDQLVSGVLEQLTTGLQLVEVVMDHHLGWLAARQGRFFFGARRPQTITREIVLDDMLEGGIAAVRMGGPRDTKNKVVVNYTDRSRLYNTFPVTAFDDPDRVRTHERAEALTLDWFCTQERAQRAAWTLLAIKRLPPVAIRATLGPKEIAMAGGDVAAVTVEALGFTLEPVRIVAIGESDGQYVVDMEREPAGLLDPRTFPTQPPVSSDPPSSPFVEVGRTLAVIWEVPPEIAGEDQIRTMIVLGNGHPEWRGAGVHMSTDGGATYERVATYAGGSAVIGAITSDEPARVPSWSDEDEIAVDVRATAGQLVGVTRDEALAGDSLSLLGGEPIGYADADLVATGRYTLVGTVRALFEQAVVAHASGELFAFLGPQPFPGFPQIEHPSSRVGVPLLFKVTSINSSGVEQDVADAVALPFTLQGIARRPSPVYDVELLIDGVGQGSLSIIGTGAIDVEIQWRYARRDIPESTQFVDGDGVTAKHPEFAGYRITVETKATSGGTYGLRRTVDQGDDETYAYTAAANTSDNGSYHPFIRFTVYVRRTIGAVLSRGQSFEVQVIQ